MSADLAERLRAPAEAERSHLATLEREIPRLVDLAVAAADVPEVAERLRQPMLWAGRPRNATLGRSLPAAADGRGRGRRPLPTR